ncbi:MAG: sensor domain-containing diguanylate cyclase [Oscillospiraceae bacterium]|nr:sensor domain-containing diguanylate cyclase [Oscillospiraceae bacterium]
MKRTTMKYSLIAVLVIFAIVPALIIAAVGVFSSVGYNNSIVESEFQDGSLAKASSLGTLFTKYTSDANTLAKLDVVINAVSGDEKAADKTVQNFAEGDNGILDVLVLDSNGTVISSATGVGNVTFEHYMDTMPSVSTLLSWDKYDTDAFFVSHEITVNAKPAGYVVVVVSPKGELLREALMGTYTDGDRARLVLIDSEGNTINFEGNGLTMKAAQLDRSIMDKLSRFFDSSTSVTSSNISESVKNGTTGSYSYVCGIIPNVTSWRWIGIMEGSAGLSPSSMISLGALLVLVVVCCLIGVMIISRILGNMRDMIKTMNSIDAEEGFSAMRFDVKNHKSELGSIQSSFNDFLDEIAINSDRYRTIAKLSDNMLFEWDFHKERMYISDNALAKFDLKPEGATLSNGRFLDGLMTPEDADKYKRDISAMLKGQKGYSAQYQIRAKTGSMVWVSLRANCITDRTGELLRVIGVMTDIDNEKNLELQLSERASIDFLSQLYNRSTFTTMLATELDRRGPKKIAVMFLDVDDFKFINDRFGHSVGDEVIKFVADTIRKKVDDRGGFAGRFGGDEFVMCITNQEDVENSEQIAMDMIDEFFMGYTSSDGVMLNVKVSIGITYCPDHTTDVNELISFSDTAMYFVKKNGKNNYHIYVPEDSENDEYRDPEGY